MTDDDDPVEVPIEDTFDLHAYAPREVKAAALAYLEAAHEKGFRQVRLIHGRGIGFQRHVVRKLLGSLDYVETFHDADASGGGWGATVVLLGPGVDRDSSTTEE